jgi:tetratricopeptide (TPR) repeat protein
MTNQTLISELKRLFDVAKRVDEFEFINILIGYNGMGDQRFLSHLYESERSIQDIKKLMDKASDKHTKTRLGLLLYGHVFEMDELYNVLGNLLRVATAVGLNYKPNLYNRIDQDDITPTDKLKHLYDHATQCRFGNFIKEIQSIYYNRIRNAFAHSSYSLVDDKFIVIKGKEIVIDGELKWSISIEYFLLPLIEESLNFISEFFSLLKSHKMAYKENKIIQGKLSNIKEPIIIIGNPEEGLIGFESFSGSSIKIKSAYGTDRFIEAMNIRLTSTSDTHNALFEEIESYNEKLRPNGINFDDLKNRVIATGEQYLVRNLSVVIYNYANNTFRSAKDKPIEQREHIMNAALPYYDLAISIDSTFGRNYLNRTVSKLELATFKKTINNDVRRQLLEELKEALIYEPTMLEVFTNSGMLEMDIAFHEDKIEMKEVSLNNAIDHFKKAIELYPHDDTIYERLATCYLEMAYISTNNQKEYFENSIKYIEIAIQKNNKLSHSLLYSSILGEYGDFDEENIQAHYDKSIEILKELENKYGENSEIKYRLGNKYMMLSMHNESLEYCEKALIEYEAGKQFNETEVKILNNIGNCLIYKFRLLKENGDKKALDTLENAILILEEAIKLDDKHTNSYFNLGLAYIEKYKVLADSKKEDFIKLAISILQKGYSLNNKSCAIQLARAYALIGDVKETTSYLKKAIDNGEDLSKEDILTNEDFKNIKDDDSLNNIFM